MSLSPKHEWDNRPIPAHPYRDTALFHGALAAVILGLAALTGEDVAKAGLIALGYFAAATGWSWWRFNRRIRAQRAADQAIEEGSQG